VEISQSTDWLVIPADASSSLLLRHVSKNQMALHSKLVSGNLRLATNKINMNVKFDPKCEQ
jgi:hypothetical protein